MQGVGGDAGGGRYCRMALTSIGFEEDRGGCAVMACQGSFKYQHDTDKDLKFIHVFPKVRC